MPAQILLTGSDGFTGQHFVPAANMQGLEVLELQGNLTDAEALMSKPIMLAVAEPTASQ